MEDRFDDVRDYLETCLEDNPEFKIKISNGYCTVDDKGNTPLDNSVKSKSPVRFTGSMLSPNSKKAIQAVIRVKISTVEGTNLKSFIDFSNNEESIRNKVISICNRLQSLGTTIYIKNEIDKGYSLYTIVSVSKQNPSDNVSKKFMNSYLSNNLDRFISSINYYLEATITRGGERYITNIDKRKIKKDKVRNKLAYRLSNFVTFHSNRYHVSLVGKTNNRSLSLTLNIEEFNKLLNKMISNSYIKRLTVSYSKEKEAYVKVVGDSIEVGYKEPETT